MLDNFCLLSIVNEVTFPTFVNEVGCMMVGEVTECLRESGWSTHKLLLIMYFPCLLAVVWQSVHVTSVKIVLVKSRLIWSVTSANFVSCRIMRGGTSMGSHRSRRHTT
ncbi:hypothetical protein PAHAL_2G038800 [Panicum hallii]|uniref:Uncharacterized protein n=1 Tax=Panicum hallii TaxID=206008 RepID=A0A2S3GVT9_9POAL|nr:hypothetical protein PAHAL_2G038800 [Panicum hallii]